MNVDCDLLLKLLAVSAGTWFWCWFLIWENEQRAKEVREKPPASESMVVIPESMDCRGEVWWNATLGDEEIACVRLYGDRFYRDAKPQRTPDD